MRPLVAFAFEATHPNIRGRLSRGPRPNIARKIDAQEFHREEELIAHDAGPLETSYASGDADQSRGSERGTPASIDRFAAEGEGPGLAHQQRPLVVYPAVSMVSVDPADDHPSRDARALASGRFSLLLALEVALTGRSAADRDGSPPVDPADEHREPALGSASHPWRTAQAWVSRRPRASPSTWLSAAGQRDTADIDAVSRGTLGGALRKIQNVALREPTTRSLQASTPEGGQVKPLTSNESQ